MKKATPFLLIIFLFLNQFIALAAGYGDDIYADKSFFWDNYDKPEWNPWDNWDDCDIFQFYTIVGNLYAIRSTRGESYSYKFDAEANKFHLKNLIHEGESGAPDYYPIQRANPLIFEYAGNVYLFEYEGQNLSYGYHFLQFHTGDIDNGKPWKKDADISGHDDDFRVYTAACTIGDYVYLIYNSYIEDNDFKTHENDIRIVKCSMDTNHHLIIHETYELNNVLDKYYYHPYAAEVFIHPDGDPRILISYSNERTKEKENYGGGVIAFNPISGKHVSIFEDRNSVDDEDEGTYNDAFSVRAIHGSLQGKRTSPAGNKTATNRIQVITNHFEDSHWDGFNFVPDCGQFVCRTYEVKEDGQYKFVEKSKIRLGFEDYHPDEWNRMNLDVDYMLEASTDSNHPDAGTKYHQKIWMFYTDKDGDIRGCKFNSDTWRFIPGSDVVSDDLDNVAAYGEEVKDSWILFGIIEGPPPCSIDWEKWKINHGKDSLTTPPSVFSYDSEKSSSVGISSETEGSAFIGISWGGEKAVSSGEIKYTSKWEKEKEYTVTKIQGSALELGLNEKMQNVAVRYYLVPQFERLTYGTFAWWITDLKIENASSVQYRFITSNYSIYSEYVPLHEEPFLMEEDSINQPSMWCWSKNNPQRSWVYNNLGSAENINFFWKDATKGSASYLATETDSIVTRSHTNEIELSADVGKPEVFKVNFGGSYSWTNGVTTRTVVSNKFSFAYENLDAKELGANISSIHTNAYIWNSVKGLPIENNLKKGQNPWYIAYSVTSVTPYDEEFFEIAFGENWETGVNTHSDELNLIVYPNPSNGNYINLIGLRTNEGTCTVKVFDNVGQNIRTINSVGASTDGELSIPFISPLKNGIYLIVVDQNGRKSIQKLLVANGF
ncbi:MAG: T9SS type A sorting domain-containing protein [Prolixibacteraceae bacterium]